MIVRLTDDISVYRERLRELVWIGVWYSGTTVEIQRQRKEEVRINPNDESTKRMFVVPMRTIGDGGVVYAIKSELVGRYKKV